MVWNLKATVHKSNLVPSPLLHPAVEPFSTVHRKKNCSLCWHRYDQKWCIAGAKKRTIIACPRLLILFLPFNSEVNYRQVKDIIKLVFPEVPFAPCQNNLWCIDRIDSKWRPTACLESLGTGIYFHYASGCVSNKSFSLLGPYIGDLSLWLFFVLFFFHSFFTIQRLIGGLGWDSAGTESLI